MFTLYIPIEYSILLNKGQKRGRGQPHTGITYQFPRGAPPEGNPEFHVPAPVGNTRGRIGGFVEVLHANIAPGVRTFLINMCKTPICPHPGPTWGRWGMTLIGALANLFCEILVH